MSLRDVIARDVERVFFNPEEFAELHVWQHDPTDPKTARTLPMMFEAFTLDGKPIPSVEGVAVFNVVVHISHAQLDYTPNKHDWVKVDDREYNVTGVFNAFGVLKIVLVANEGLR